MKSLKLNFSLKKKLILSFMLFGGIPTFIVSFITWKNNVTTLTRQAEERLTIIRENKAHAIEELFTTMTAQIKTLSTNTSTIEAMKEFDRGFQIYFDEVESSNYVANPKESLKSYYSDYFSKEFLNTNKKNNRDVVGFIDNFDSNTISLQYSYISKNKHPLGSKHLLDAADDGSVWSDAHARFHPAFKNYLEEFGYYDIFLVEPKNGKVVYSVFKELDFATSLLTGPYANTNFAKAFKKANAATETSYAVAVDLEPYYPSYNAPAGFIASPIFDGKKKVGVLVFQIPVDKLNSIMTSGQKWKEQGFGDSGQAYLIGKDLKMRSISRHYVENKDKFLKMVAENGATQENIEFMNLKGTTALFLTVKTKGAKAAIQGTPGRAISKDERGIEVFSAFTPVKVSGLDWYVMAEIEEAEALADVYSLAWLMSLILLVSGISIFVFAWMFSSGLAGKMARRVSGLHTTAKNTKQSSDDVKDASQKVAASAVEQAAAIQETVATLNEITAMVNKSVEYAKLSNDKAQSSHSIAEEGKMAVTEMVRAMDEINQSNHIIMKKVNESNDNIAGVVKIINEIANRTNVINDIVFQTKLLSFNASVEAARAGEHGKGFAVVAEEIGNLAQMSGDAAKEIREMLAVSVDKVESVVKQTGASVQKQIESGKVKVESGVSIAKRCGEVLDEVVANVGEVKQMMDEISVSSEEQAEGVSNITIAMNELDATTQMNSDVANRTSNYSEKLNTHSESLDNIVKDLEVEIFGEEGSGAAAALIKEAKPASKVISIEKKRVEKKEPTKKVEKKSAKQPVVVQEETTVKKAVGYEDIPSSDDPRFEDF